MPCAIRSSLVPVAALVCLVVAGCDSDAIAPETAQELDGPAVAVGSGTARAFVVMDGGTARSVGIALTDDALQGLPSTMTEWQLALPAGTTARPWDHMTLDWNPQGHEPTPIYGVPHFDFHFYTISPAEQTSIAGGPDTTTVASQYVPANYASQVVSVPQMGVHWADTLAAEFHGHPFDQTLIYGFYRGRMVFMEPMVTRAYLQSGADLQRAVPQPAAFQTAGAYPTRFSIRHDAAAHRILVSLDSLTAR